MRLGTVLQGGYLLDSPEDFNEYCWLEDLDEYDWPLLDYSMIDNPGEENSAGRMTQRSHEISSSMNSFASTASKATALASSMDGCMDEKTYDDVNSWNSQSWQWRNFIKDHVLLDVDEYMFGIVQSVRKSKKFSFDDPLDGAEAVSYWTENILKAGH